MKLVLRDYKIKKVEGLNEIRTREDLKKFLNEFIVEGDIFITVAKRLAYIIRKDEDGNVKVYRRRGNIFDDSLELEELNEEQARRGLLRIKRFINKKFFFN